MNITTEEGITIIGDDLKKVFPNFNIMEQPTQFVDGKVVAAGTYKLKNEYSVLPDINTIINESREEIEKLNPSLLYSFNVKKITHDDGIKYVTYISRGVNL
jgi:hypothetical protein